MAVTKPDFESPALTVDQVAELLNVSRKTVYSLVQTRQMPGAVKLGRAIRIHGPTVLAWLKGAAVVPSRKRR